MSERTAIFLCITNVFIISLSIITMGLCFQTNNISFGSIDPNKEVVRLPKAPALYKFGDNILINGIAPGVIASDPSPNYEYGTWEYIVINKRLGNYILERNEHRINIQPCDEHQLSKLKPNLLINPFPNHERVSDKNE